MTAERGDDGNIGGWAGRALLGGAVVIGAVVMSASLASAPNFEGGVGLGDQAGGGVDLEVNEAQLPVPEPAAAAPSSQVPVSPVTGVPLATSAGSDVQLSVPATIPLVLRASVDLRGYYALLDAGETAVAFGRLTPDRQSELGGPVNFEGLWRAVHTVVAEVPVCLQNGSQMSCTVTVRLTGVDGSCVTGTNELGLELGADRFYIAAERSVSQEPCTT